MNWRSFFGFFSLKRPLAGILKTAAIMAVLLPINQALALVIDNFNVDGPSLESVNPGDVNVVKSGTQAGAGIIGGTRYLYLRMITGTGTRKATALVEDGFYTNSNETDVTSEARIRYTGSTNPNTFGLAANLCVGDKIRLNYSTDLTVSNFTIQVYTSATQGSEQVFTLPGTGGLPAVLDVDFSAFTTIAGLTAVDFCNVGAIRLSWSGVQRLDLDIDQIEIPEDVSYACTRKTFASASPPLGPLQNITYPATTTFPKTVTAQVSFTVGAAADIQPGALTITDTLDIGFSYVGGSTLQTSPAPVVISGDPGIAGQVLTWTNTALIPAGTAVTFQYQVTVSEPPALPNPPAYRRNKVRLQVPGLPVSEPPICSAGVNQLPPAPPEYTCNSKTFRSDSLSLPASPYLIFPTGTTFPQTITAEVTFTNTGAVSIPANALTIRDTLDAGLSYVSGTTQQTVGPTPPDIISGDPGGSPGPVLTWLNAAAVPVAPNNTVRFEYDVLVTSLSPGQVLGNAVQIQWGALTRLCSARVTLGSPPGGAPGVNPLGMLIAALMLALTAVFAYRRRSL